MTMSRRTLLGAAAAVAAGSLLAATAARAASPEVFQSRAPFGKDAAAGGYDVVAYHVEGKPVLGSTAHSAEWRGAMWFFSSNDNLEKFLAEPLKYAPQYGGFCAFAVAHGSTAPGDPKVFRIVNGKLYLNLDPGVQRQWERDRDRFIQRADKAWPGLIGK